MSALTGSQINQSYQGLLKLADSTTGITSTVQSIQDGLGNDTGFKIATNRLEGGNLVNIYKPTVGKYYGMGVGSTSPTPAAGSQNIMLSQWFYDNGIHSYSAFTINCLTLEAGTSIDVAFYNAQYLENYGYVPYQKLSTEVNIPTTSTGFKVGTFASPLTFSGTGPGVYFCVFRLNTSGTPVLRFGGISLNSGQNLNGLIVANLGFVFNTANTAALVSTQANSTTNTLGAVSYSTASFPTTWTSTELNTISSVVVPQMGFLLHTVR